MIITNEKYSITETTDSVEITLRYRKSLFMFLQYSYLLLIAIFLLIVILATITPDMVDGSIIRAQAYKLILIGLLIIIIPLLILEIIWLLMGNEKVTITSEFIQINHVIFGINISKRLSIKSISSIMESNQTENWQNYWSSKRGLLLFWMYYRGRISINSGKTIFNEIKTYRFGSILDDEGSTYILGRIHDKFPSYPIHFKVK